MLPIRRATPADIPALHALIERAYRGPEARAGWTHEADYLTGPRTDAATLAGVIADPAATMLLAVDGDRIAACVQVTDIGDGLAYMGMLAVEPTAQAGGTGRTMIAAAEDFARGLGATRMEMTVVDRRATLIAYYERRGYVLTGETRPFPAALVERVPLAFVVLAKPL
jgi:GNAT superfamily N-acetyltransferase